MDCKIIEVKPERQMCRPVSCLTWQPRKARTPKICLVLSALLTMVIK